MPLQKHNLIDQPQFFDEIAAWHQEEWSHLNPGETLAMRKERMQVFMTDSFIETLWLVEEEGKLLGTAAVVACDMDTRPELTPWLASVFTTEAARGKGIGSMMVQHMMDESKKQGLKTIYLYTPKSEPFYLRLGWETLEQTVFEGEQVTVMKYDF